MSNLGANVAKLFVMLALACLPALAQQDVPDAPTPKPSAQFPSNAPPAPKNTHTEQQPTDAAPTTSPVPRCVCAAGVWFGVVGAASVGCCSVWVFLGAGGALDGNCALGLGVGASGTSCWANAGKQANANITKSFATFAPRFDILFPP